MMLRGLILIVLMVAALKAVDAKKFTEDELRWELKQLGGRTKELDMWVCIAKHESDLDTKAINKDNDDRSWDYGIFQINDRYWCQGQYHGSSNGCRKNCIDFLQNDIRSAFSCAQLIKREQGWNAWAVVSVQKKCSQYL